jgi:beta-lactamase regulating signal transducer with metallopeptidase domain
MIAGLIGAAAVTSVLALAALLVSRWFRPGDAALWHAVWSALAVAALTTPWLAAMLPPVSIGVPDTPFIESVAAADVGGRWWTAAGIVHLTVAGFLALRLLAGFLLVRRLARRSDSVEGLWRARLAAVAPEAVALCRTHARVHVPLVVGWRRPLILLPLAWMQWEDARLGAVLRHELAHVRRGDYAWNLAAALLPVLYWPNPIAWLIARRIRLHAELACDRRAAPEVGAATYAGVLVQSAREIMAHGSGTRVLAPGAATNLEARIAALLSSTEAATQSSGRVTGAVVLGLASLVLLAMTIRLVAASPDPDAGFGFLTDHIESHQRAHVQRH